MTTVPQLIVDVDIGNDDFLSLMILFWAETFNLLVIKMLVCSEGNTSLYYSCKNLVRFLEIINRTDVPVYKGTETSFLNISQTERFFGEDGFGDLSYSSEPDLSIIKEEPAAIAIGNLVLQNPNQITLICLAALTNVALSLRLYSEFSKNLKDIWIMGGNYIANSDFAGTAEFNFYADPEAAFIVLENIEKPIYQLTWETCQIPKITTKWRFTEFVNKSNPALALLTEADEKVFENITIWDPCDCFLVAAFVDQKDIILNETLHSSSVELCGYETRGQMVLDFDKTKPKNIHLIEDIDAENFKNLLLKLKSPSS